MSDIALQVTEIPAGEDPRLTLNLDKDGIPASVKITLSFSGDWANVYDDEIETEDDARQATALDIFRAVLAAVQ